jgi:cytochrome oxidase Cu insertion factor (SCO1/SenC/PrrC family)/uncharacterized membrane protein YozB (DUF420 family)
MSVSRFYRRGFLIVVSTVIASALVALAAARSGKGPPRAAQDLGDFGETVGPFKLIERSGRSVSNEDLDGRVWIASFIFTRCPLSCPRITSVMKSLQDRLVGSQVQLVSLSVDPDHDTPAVLADYARRFVADTDRWWFLTGSRPAIYDLIRGRFKLSVTQNPSPDPEGRTEAISHSDRLALVDRGRIVGLFDSNDPAALDDLIGQARRRSNPAWIKALPTLNASLNGICAMLLLIGWSFIRLRPRLAFEPQRAASTAGAYHLDDPSVRGHAAGMVLAVIASALFLASYLVYHYHAGSVSFRGVGSVRLLYFTILISHTLLASFGVVPLVVITLLRALRRDFARHASIASMTLPIWLYVSVTGVVIYLMLYHLPVQPSHPETAF